MKSILIRTFRTVLIRTFITVSFLLFYSVSPNQEPAKKTKIEQVVTESIIPQMKSVVEAEKDSVNEVSEEIQKAREMALEFKKEAVKTIKEQTKKERQLLRAVNTKETEISKLEQSIKEKDSLIVMLIVEKHKDPEIVKDSICVKWKFLAKKIDENCIKWSYDVAVVN